MIPLVSNRRASRCLNDQLAVVTLLERYIGRLLHDFDWFDDCDLDNRAAHTAYRVDHLDLIKPAILLGGTGNAHLSIST